MDKTKLAYSEVSLILKSLEDELINKIPDNVKNFFEEEKDSEYIPTINFEKPLNEQKLERETIVLLTILKLKYWCENEQEKKELIEQLMLNDKETKEILNKKYDFNEVLKKNINLEKPNHPLELIQVPKQNFIQRFFERIMKGTTLWNIITKKNIKN